MGNNGHGQLGDGTTTDHETPIQTIDLTGVKDIVVEQSAPADMFVYALKADGTVWAWVANIGNGTINPVQVVGLTDIIDIKTVFNTSYALKKDGTVWAWGAGLLKDGTPVEHLTPTQMCSLTGITDIVIPRFSYSPYLLRNDGTVWKAYFDGCTQL